MKRNRLFTFLFILVFFAGIASSCASTRNPYKKRDKKAPCDCPRFNNSRYKHSSLDLYQEEACSYPLT